MNTLTPTVLDDYSGVSGVSGYMRETLYPVPPVLPPFTEYCRQHGQEFANVSGNVLFDCPVCRQQYIRGLYAVSQARQRAEPLTVATNAIEDEAVEGEGVGVTWHDWSWWAFYGMLGCGVCFWAGLAWELWGNR